jgi:hypothetical protein
MRYTVNMTSPLLMPPPTNLRLTREDAANMVEGDVYNICERVAEISDRLFIAPQFGQPKPWVVMETGNDGVDYFVLSAEELDARIIDRINYIRGVPFEKRMATLEAENEAWEKQQHDEELDRLYEQIGAPMKSQFYHDGFIEHRAESYPKAGVTGRKGSKDKS